MNDILNIDNSDALGKQLTASVDKNNKLSRILQNTGILGTDPDSAVGKCINQMMDEYIAAANNMIAPAYVRLLAEDLACSVLLSRSAMEMIITLHRPSKSPSEKGKANRDVYKTAIALMDKSSSMKMKIIKMLNAEVRPPAEKTFQDLLNEISKETEETIDISEELNASAKKEQRSS